MSRFQNGTNGYTNGHHDQEGSARHEEGYGDGSSVGIGRQNRVGGYGSFHSNGVVEESDHQQNPNANDLTPESDPSAPHWRRRPGRWDREWSDSGRSWEAPGLGTNESHRYGDGPGGRQIEDVVQYIQDKWNFMTKEDCVPVHVTLQLMDHSSLGRGNDYYDFQDTNKRLQKAMKAIVNEHHQGFNSSIGTFHKIQSSIQSSQIRVRTLRESLLHAKSNLLVTKPELKGLAATSQNYEDMLQVIGQIEKIQLLPEQLDAKISEKHFLSAVDVLEDALRLIRRSNLENIGALADLQIYFSNQETSLTDILVEELHDHLYLKSPYCQDRWKSFASKTVELIESGLDAPSRTRPIYRFLGNLDTSTLMIDNASQNPESDSFEYIHMLIESLNKMGRLEVAVERMENRLPMELFAIVDKTNHEVDSRHPAYLRTQNKDSSNKLSLDLDNSGRTDILHDLLWTLYSKFEAIAEGHRAVHAVVVGILQREGLRQSSRMLGGFKELWKLYQSEIRSLLHDYLATDGNQVYRSGQIAVGSANVFQRTPRDKSKRVFKLEQIDAANTGIANEQQELDKILQSSVPGLVSKSQGKSGVDKTNRNLNHDNTAIGHKLLVEPSVFNISLLLPPSLSFLQSLREIVPPDSDIAISTLTSFLDDFLINVFYPQFEETVTELCTQSFMELDAFQEDSRWSDYARNPIFKGASTIFSLVKVFCEMFDTIPQDQTFTQLIITQLVAYYDKCCQWYKALVTHTQVDGALRLKTAAAFIGNSDIQNIVKTLWETKDSNREDLRRKEVELLVAKTNETPLEPFDIISDRRSVVSLCLLYTSMQWLASRLSQLRHIIPDKAVSASQASGKSRQSSRWTLLGANKMQDDERPVQLPMTRDSAIAFDGVVSSFRDLAMTGLLTLHVDIRCGIIHMISRTFNAFYQLEQPANEPDPSVMSLNADLLSFDDNVVHYLPSDEHSFIITGIGLLIDYILVADASKISVMNQNGCGRMQLNILVLQQNLKSIEEDASLVRSAQFFELFAEGADAIVKRAKETGGKDLGLSLEELKEVVELCHSEGLRSTQRDVAMQAKRTLNDHLLQLSESMWNS